jgi:hypothetical protein
MGPAAAKLSGKWQSDVRVQCSGESQGTNAPDLTTEYKKINSFLSFLLSSWSGLFNLLIVGVKDFCCT